MTQSFLNETSRGKHTELLAAFGLLFSKARRFYQYKAETASSGNLRRHFATLAELHQQILYLLPAPNSDCAISEGMTALYELSAWYANKRSHISLSTLQHQLVQQLQLQKTAIRNFDLGPYQNSLLHFTASLQIAADQLANVQTR